MSSLQKTRAKTKTSKRIKIVHEDDATLVVDKPPSIPVHPCGRYRHNTVIFILAKVRFWDFYLYYCSHLLNCGDKL